MINWRAIVEDLSWSECDDLGNALYRRRKIIVAEHVQDYPKPSDDIINDGSHIMAIKRYREANPTLSLMECKIVMDSYRK